MDSHSLLRLKHIIGDPSKGEPGLVPIGRTAWHKLVKAGKVPPPLKIGRIALWRRDDVLAFISTLSHGGAA